MGLGAYAGVCRGCVATGTESLEQTMGTTRAALLFACCLLVGLITNVAGVPGEILGCDKGGWGWLPAAEVIITLSSQSSWGQVPELPT